MPLYLHLFHGRSHPDDQLDDWGREGPTFGPLASISTTYGSAPRLFFPDDSEGYLTEVEGLIYYDGYYYGDLSLFDSPNFEEATATFSQREAIPPGMPCPPDPVPPEPDRFPVRQMAEIPALQRTALYVAEVDKVVTPENECGIFAITPAAESPTLDAMDKALIDCLVRLRDQQSLGRENDDLIQHAVSALAAKLGPFDPTAGFDSVEQAGYLIHATANPAASVKAVIAHNLDQGEFGFCTGLLMDW